MKSTIEEISSTVTKINIEIPEEIVRSKLDKAYRDLTKTAKIAGFRKGKVPRSLIVQKYQPAVTSDLLNTLIPETISTAIKENNLRSVSQPVVGNIKLEEGKPLSFDATVEVLPKFRLKDFSDTELTCKIERVSDADIEHILNRFQDSLAVLESSNSKSIEVGDYVIFDHKCEADGKTVPKLTASNAQIIVGNNLFFKEIENAMTGMKKGQTGEIPFTFPEDFHMKGLAGAASVFTITINEIKHRKLPELNDEFAKQAGKGESLQEMKGLIRTDLESVRRNNARLRLKQELLDKLQAENPVTPPDVLKKAETERRLRDIENKPKPEGQDSQTGEELRVKVEQEAVRALSREMIIDSFTEERSISITEEEVSFELNRMAASLGETPQVFSRRLKEDRNAYTNFEQRLLNEKTLDAMLDTIKIEEVFIAQKSDKEKGDV